MEKNNSVVDVHLGGDFQLHFLSPTACSLKGLIIKNPGIKKAFDENLWSLNKNTSSVYEKVLENSRKKFLDRKVYFSHIFNLYSEAGKHQNVVVFNFLKKVHQDYDANFFIFVI